ncbi:hypothetical protein [Amycolatopsis sp. H20-H5]|uniref:hypothetical protein n=1 Tax=Amycolatopsis sp. H20-H5 TaxID=3046309 RepID=UPI002DBF47FE|nr:hypothetical protein [Amycolatopsis sp. H20-H5]
MTDAIAHLIGLELEDEQSPWHRTFPRRSELAKRYQVSLRTVSSAFALLGVRGLVVKHGRRYASARQSDRPANRLAALAADLAKAINDRTLTGRLPVQREIAHRYNTNDPLVSKAITILVQQGFVNGDHRTVAAHPPTTFTPPERQKRSPRLDRPRRINRKTPERHVFSPTQLIINDLVHEHPAGLDHAGIYAPDDIAEQYKVSSEVAGDVYFGVLQRY